MNTKRNTQKVSPRQPRKRVMIPAEVVGVSRKSQASNLNYARARVVKAFATHWRSILKKPGNIAENRADCFFAGSTAEQESLARTFYGRKHAEKMAGLNSNEIRDMLSPWLEHALKYWLDGKSMENFFLKELPTGEYVTIINAYTSYGSGVLIDRYPGKRAFYDDLYERLLGGSISTGGIIRVYKSTGEAFTPTETRTSRVGIRNDLRDGINEAADEDPWIITMKPKGGNIVHMDGEDLRCVVIAEVHK